MTTETQEEITLDDVLNTRENSKTTTPATTPAATANTEDTSPTAAAANTTEGKTKEQVAAEEAANVVDNTNNLKNLLSSFSNETELDDENKGVRTKLLEKYEGTSFDENGNILDKEGKILTSFDDLLKYSTEEDTVKLDEKGNEVNNDGEIVKTKLELAIENTVINKLHNESDYEFQDEDGSVKIYSDDDKGFKEFTNDVSGQRFMEWKEEFFGQNPELAEITKHILSGKSLDTFSNDIDYNEIDATKLSRDDKLKYIRRSYEITGLNEERINGLVQMFIDSNSIDTEVTKALPALQANEELVKENRDSAYLQSIDERNAKVEEYWDTVEDVVNKGSIADITIPKEEKEAFFHYLSQPINDKGQSKEMIDTSKETIEQQLQIKYLRFKGYDLSKLIDSKVQTKRVETLKEQIRRSAKLKVTAINDAKTGKTSGDADISINSLLT